MNEDQLIVEINNQINYKKIEQLNIKEVTWKESEYQIQLNYKLEDLPQDFGDKIIMRTEEDFRWLSQSLSTFQDKGIIIPKFKTTTYVEAFLDIWTQLQVQEESHKASQNQLKQQMTIRWLKLISNITLKQINNFAVEAGKPLFVFISPSYRLYKNPIYLKQQSKSISSKFKSFWQNIIPFGKNEQYSNKKILSMRDRIKIEVESKMKFQMKVLEYAKHLQRLLNEFMQDKQNIRKKIQTVYRLYYKIFNHNSLIEHIITQIAQNESNLSHTQIDKAQLEENGQTYFRYLEQEQKILNKKWKQIVEKGIKQMTSEECSISLIPK